MFLWLALALTLGSLLFAQTPKLIFQTFAAREGLSQDVTLCLMQDHEGFLWVGTQSGLNRFDGYQFVSYRYDPSQAGSISGDEILSLCQDSKERLWVGTQTAGLNLYHPLTDSFTSYRNDPKDPDSLSFNAIQEIIEDQGMLWIPTWGGGLNHFDPETGKATRFRHDPDKSTSIAHDIIWDIAPAADGSYWLATETGVDRFDPKSAIFSHYRHNPGDPKTLSSPRTIAVLPNPDGSVWVGTMDQGLNLLDSKTGKVKRFPFGLEHPGALLSNSVNSIYRDKQQRIWVGSDAGVSLYLPENDSFFNYTGSASDPQAMRDHTSVLRISEDHNDNLWLSTTQGLVRCQPKSAVFGYYQRRDENGKYITSENYYSLQTQDNRYLWMGGDTGLSRFDRTTGAFDHWQPKPSEPGAPENIITFLSFDSKNRLWLANQKRLMLFDQTTETFSTVTTEQTDLSDFAFSYGGVLWIGTREGLLGFNPETGVKQRYFHDPKDPGSLAHDAVISLFVDSKQRIWTGTYGAGLDLLEPGQRSFRHFLQKPGLVTSLANNAITVVREAPDGTIWVGTRAGLSRWIENDTFKSYWQKDGLPNTFINEMLFDDQGMIWISTDGGLARMDPQSETFVRYDENDGLLGNIFNGGAAARFPDGTLVFGGNGFNLFHPDKINLVPSHAKVVLTELLLFNETARLQGLEPLSPLSKPLHQLDELVLSYKDYVFAFRFAALDYSFSERRTYEYKLDGLDSTWLPASPDNRLASYTSLPGGSYTLHVRGHDKRGNLFEESSLHLRITPPPWKTRWAYALYLLIFLAAIYAYTHFQQRKLEKERQIVQRLNEVDRLKDAFLANTSHELRTPLHGMIGLAEAVLDHHSDKLDDTARCNIEMIVSSGLRLSHLINDILDFSKLQHNSLQCNLQAVDLCGTVHVVMGLTRPLCGEKALELINEIPIDLPLVQADENRLQQILFNLIGNAIKFTESGFVRATAKLNGNEVRVEVSDTGIGIASGKCEEIFKAFQQADGSTSREYGGAGLGLAVTRKLVELQGGKIWATSEPAHGSTFSFTLPCADPDQSSESARIFDERQVVKAGRFVPVAHIDTLHGPQHHETAKFRILVVDDDPVNRMVLINHLSHDYVVVAVESGMAAIKAVEDYQGFDLILLDIMMPKMTGFDVCRHLRTIFPSHELPVIFLTAKMHANDVVTGFETGANDYIIKPVSKGELLMRVETHLQLLDANRNLEAKVIDRTRHLVETQKELLREAHVAGMAEIAVDVMHNVGNRLNSLGTSVQLIQELAEKDRKGIALLERFTEAVVENAHDLESFFASDPRVVKLPEYLPRITRRIISTQESLRSECIKLNAHVKAMTEILQAQQKHSGMTGLVTEENINELIQAVLNMGALSLDSKNGKIESTLSDGLPPVILNRVRLIRVLMCLLQNAIDAIEAKGSQSLIAISSTLEPSGVVVSISDNGEGITAENLVKIFAYGFSTRANAQGFGLHYCANTVREMGAEISIDSQGSDTGTCVRLTFPLVAVNREDH